MGGVALLYIGLPLPGRNPARLEKVAREASLKRGDRVSVLAFRTL